MKCRLFTSVKIGRRGTPLTISVSKVLPNASERDARCEQTEWNGRLALPDCKSKFTLCIPRIVEKIIPADSEGALLLLIFFLPSFQPSREGKRVSGVLETVQFYCRSLPM